MKKQFVTLALLIIALFAVCVCAASAEEPLPAKISEFFSDSSFADAEIIGTARWNTGWFVLVRKGGSNIVYSFAPSENGWKNDFSAAKGVPQGDVRMFVTDSIDEYMAQQSYKGPFLVFEQYSAAEKSVTLFAAYQHNSSGQWNLIRLFGGGFDHMVLQKGVITYYRDATLSEVAGTAKGTFQRNLRYVNLSSLPQTYKKAASSLTKPPVLPEGSELVATDIQFEGGKKYSVYSAPDKTSLRSSNGKAAVSTNGWIQVFGKENNWILIQYSIDKDHYRFGYIDAASLPKKAKVADLAFDRYNAAVSENVSVTDDPLFSRSEIASLKGGENVILLSKMGNWAYIEVPGCRGFVPWSSLSISSAAVEGFNIFTGKDGRQYDMFEIQKLLYDDAHHVYAVSGQYERFVEDNECYEGDLTGEVVTYNLAPDFRAEMQSPSQPDPEAYASVTDLYTWYIDAYLEGKAPEGGNLVFSCDLTDAQAETTPVDFWFVTAYIRLNDKNEIEYMKSCYVPWG